MLFRVVQWKEKEQWWQIAVRDIDFHSAYGKALEQVAWRGDAISILQDIQNLTGFLFRFLVINSKV